MTEREAIRLALGYLRLAPMSNYAGLRIKVQQAIDVLEEAARGTEADGAKPLERKARSR